MLQNANDVGLLTSLPTIEEVLDDHAPELGCDFTAYRNHAYRVVNLCLAVAADNHVQLEKIAVAAVFHDLGIWTNHTFDYIAPSVGLAREHLAARGMGEWVTLGLRRFGLPRTFIAAVDVAWPNAGFHRRLVQLTADRFLKHPLTPLPMVKW